MIYSYAWKRNMAVPAQVVGERLRAITSRDGELKRAAVVDDARPGDSLLHPLFEWNDAQAAELYREHQAGGIIRNITVLVSRRNTGAKEPVRAFVSVKPEDETRKYKFIGTVLSDDGDRAALLQDALRDFAAFRAKYYMLSELAEVFAVIDSLPPAA